jgi:hypothetical protein
MPYSALCTLHLAIALICFATGFLSSIAYTRFTLRPDSQNHRASEHLYLHSFNTVKHHVVGQAGFGHRVISRKLLFKALSQVKEEETPKTPVLRESHFVTQVSVGELLASQGTYSKLPISDLFIYDRD